MTTRAPKNPTDSQRRVVCGRLMNSDGSPVVGEHVQAYVKRLRRDDEPLGRPARTGDDGRYVIKYAAGKRPPDLYVRVRRGKEVVATSPVVLGAGPKETINVVVGGVYRGPSQYERLVHRIGPVLAADGAKAEALADFDEDDLAFLSAKSGVDPRELVLLKQSAGLAHETRLPVELFYGLGRQRIPLSLPALLAQDPAKRRAAAKAALDEGQIPTRMADTVARGLDKLDELTVEEALRDPRVRGETTLGGLLGVAGLAPGKRKRLVQAYMQHDGPTESFWKSIRVTHGFSQVEVDRVQLTLQLGAVTQNHLPLVRALQGTVRALKDLAKLDKDDWRRLVRGDGGGHAVGLPAYLQAAGLTEDDYVEMLFRVVEQAFPTAMVACRIGAFPNAQPLERFFAANPDFEMRSTPVAVYLRQNPRALDGLGGDDERALVTKRLKGLERVYRIAPDGARVETMRVLMEGGVDSAQKVRVLGKAAFSRRYEERLGRERVETVWAKANNASALAAVLVARHHAMFDRTPVAVLPKRPATLKKFPDYESLFGSLDFCSCEQCQSVYSPAAYLVDALHWLHNRPSKRAGKTALDILFDDRRADIGTIELSCKNTNTPLPYIDLVSEVLELLVAPPTGPWPAYQTTGTPADLLAHPEHLHEAAYDVLAGSKAGTGRDAVFPFGLPYDLWLEEARTYLGQLGVTRSALMDALHDGGPPWAWTDAGVAVEVLGSSPLEWDIVAGKPLSPPRSPEDFWGMSGEAGWVGMLANVSTWLARATPPLAESLTRFDELADLLRADFVQGAGALGVWFDGDSCDTAKAALVGLKAVHLGRLHRFVRLQRRLGWSASDLDRAIAVLGAGTLDEAFLVKVSHVLRGLADLDLPLQELLTWWGPLDTRRWRPRLRREVPAGAPMGARGMGFVFGTTLSPQPDKAEDQSQYDRLFQTSTTAASGTTTTSATEPTFGIAPDGAALLDETKDIADYVASLTGALGITADDLAALLPRLPDAKLTLANLSALFRHVSVARALDLTVRQLASVIDLTGIDPFDAAHTEQTLHLLREVRAIRSSGFSIEELDYLLRHVDSRPATLEPQPADIGRLLLDLRDALRRVEADHPLPAELASDDDLHRRLFAKLSETLSGADVTTALDVIDVPAGEPLPANAEQVIDEQLADLVDLDDAKKKLVDDMDPAYLGSRRARLLYVLGEAETEQDLRDRLARYLALLLPPADVEHALSVIDIAAGDPPPANAGQVIDERLASVMDTVEAKQRLADPADPAYLGESRGRLLYVLGALIGRLRRAGKESAVIEKLSASLGLDPAVTAPLVRTHLKHPNAAGMPLVELLTGDVLRDFAAMDDSGEPVVPTVADLPDSFAAYLRLHKASMLLRRFRVTLDELDWVMVEGPARGTLDVQALPMAPAVSGGVLYGSWRRLRDAAVLRDGLVPRRLFDVFTAAAAAETGPMGGTAAVVAAAHEALLTTLERRTRWSREDIEVLAGTPPRSGTPATAGALGFAYPADWKDERPLERMAEAMAIVRRVGQPAETVWGWRRVPLPGDFVPTDATRALAAQRLQADGVKQAVRARYDDSQWHEVARSLRDRLRSRQREALVGWLIAHDGRFDDANALSEHLLLDVQMSPCQLTSRIKQAMNGVQLYVQRALLNLEPDVELSSDDAREWKWMKNYRVWEASRKVFLYPENWIEPGLRDDKSPFFEELENDLLQSEITAESAERAVLGYLEKLDEVARLEVAGFFHQKPTAGDSADILHVFGRTRGTPPRYYYRQRVDGWRWTPWEKVEVDVEGDHLLPVVHNRRLYIFWAQITEAAVEENGALSASGDSHAASEPIRYFQIRLAWAERRSDKWSGKKLSTMQIGATHQDYLRLSCGLRKSGQARKSDFFFRAYDDNGDLFIEPIRYVRAAGKDCSSYVRLDRFRLSGCDGTLSLEPQSSSASLTVRKPSNTQTIDQSFAWDGLSADSGLTLPATNPASGSPEMEPTLSKSPSRFEVVPATMTGFRSAEAFFYQDLRRSFFVEPRDSYRWVRQPPEWTDPRLIPVDVARVLSELWPPTLWRGRPTPPWPDPWVYDPGAFVTDPSPVALTTTPALVGEAEAGPGGLLAVGAKGLGDTFGPRVAFIGPTAMTPRANKVAVQSVARIVADNPGELLTLRSATAPAQAAGLRVLTMETTYRLPSSKVEVYSPGTMLKEWDDKRYLFSPFYHPYLDVMMRQLNRVGLDGLLDASPSGPEPLLRRQRLAHSFFQSLYGPLAVDKPYPKDEFDFSPRGAYATYNWEVFFHVPFLVATHLSSNQRFEDAMRWFHYLFDPTEASGEPAPQRFWKIRPFFELFYGEDAEAGPIHELLLLLHYDGSDPELLETRDALVDQVAEWRRKPFNPHAIARLRPTAYQKAVFMRYLDNLIEWGDQLFRRDTTESVNEATQLYVLAAQLLGRRPRRVEVEPPVPRTFNALLDAGLDEFSNALVEEVEGFLPEVTSGTGDVHEDDVPLIGPTLFFCVSPNEQLLTDYWDRVADRLFKLRHCMNIEGVVRQLPLFEPPIDPALLVRAAEAGLDLAGALSDLNAPPPLHRFPVLAHKATELCTDVRGLGQALLSALEKRDAEEMALLRAGHESKLQTAMVETRNKQIDEAKEALESLKRSKEKAEIRWKYYRSREFVNDAETAQFGLLAAAGVLDVAAGVAHLVGAATGAVPNFTAGVAGFGGSPLVTTEYGGGHGANIAMAVAEGLKVGAAALDRGGSLAGIMGNYQRRMDDWTLQADIAQKDIQGLERQILGAEIRVAVAEKELDTLKLQIEQSKETEEFLRDKYTNAQLYQWMTGQLSSLYFESYKLAYDLAKRAERAWQFELAQPDRSFIQFGYWDGLKKGLLSGERLHHDLKRMDVAYLDDHRREYELTHHASLRKLDPIALLRLRRDGECIVRVPEAWFDLDSPGHYLRRIRTVALSIPAVAGPYVPVRCTLTLLRSSTRVSPNVGPGYARTSASDPRFRDDIIGLQSIVTSRAEEDSGLFETNLRDERYLPFEGAGADSEWRLELPKAFRQFDYDTISDAVLHIRYTARDGGAALKQAAEAQLHGALQALVLGSQASTPAGQGEGMFHLASARRDFPDAWARFLAPPDGQTDQAITFDFGSTRFPFAFQAATIKVAGFELIMVVRDTDASQTAVKMSVAAPGGGAAEVVDLQSDATELGGLPHGGYGYVNATKDPGDWVVTFTEADNAAAAASALIDVHGHRRLNPAIVEDLILVLRYKVAS